MLSLGLMLLSSAAAVAPVTSCQSLQAMSTPQVAITAEAMPAGPFVPPGTAAAAGARAHPRTSHDALNSMATNSPASATIRRRGVFS